MARGILELVLRDWVRLRSQRPVATVGGDLTQESSTCALKGRNVLWVPVQVLS